MKLPRPFSMALSVVISVLLMRILVTMERVSWIDSPWKLIVADVVGTIVVTLLTTFYIADIVKCYHEWKQDNRL